MLGFLQEICRTKTPTIQTLTPEKRKLFPDAFLENLRKRNKLSCLPLDSLSNIDFNDNLNIEIVNLKES